MRKDRGDSEADRVRDGRYGLNAIEILIVMVLVAPVVWVLRLFRR